MARVRLAHDSPLFLLALGSLFLGSSCVPRTRPLAEARPVAPTTASEAAPPAVPPGSGAVPSQGESGAAEPDDPVDRIIDTADELYMEGMAALAREDRDAARAAFDRSVAAYLTAPPALKMDVRLMQEFQDLLQEIHQAVVEDQHGAPPPPLQEDLKAITAYLTPQQAAQERQKVKERNATVVFDLPVEINDKVLAFIDAFTGPRKKLFEPGMVRSGRYVGMIRRVFQSQGIPQDLSYLVHVESAFTPSAYSRARA
ncbi:MAG: hypothetical protein ACE5ID_09260, partial [Acidobacteriota bacterium]